MIDPVAETLRAAAARFGPSMALREYGSLVRQGDGRERLVYRPRPAPIPQADPGEWAELARRRAELDQLTRGG